MTHIDSMYHSQQSDMHTCIVSAYLWICTENAVKATPSPTPKKYRDLAPYLPPLTSLSPDWPGLFTGCIIHNLRYLPDHNIHGYPALILSHISSTEQINFTIVGFGKFADVVLNLEPVKRLSLAL